MSEGAFRTVQLGKEGTFGTEVDADVLLPVDVGSGELTLDRASTIPDEDFGTIVQNLAGRGSTGVRIATGSVSQQASFELVPYLLEAAIGTADTSGTAAPYTHVFTADATSDTSCSYTWEVDEGTQDWIGTGVQVVRFDMGYDAVGAGTNAMWTINADLQGANNATGTATASLSAPTTIQTMEGHLTQLYEGPAGTAYASLSELSASLVSYRVTVECPKPLRPYGGTADIAAAHGVQKRTATIEAMLKISATTITDIWDIYNVSGALPTNRRWRVKANGSNSALLTIDHMLQFTDVHVEPDGRDGERLLSIAATCVYDSTNSSDLLLTFQNGISSYA